MGSVVKPASPLLVSTMGRKTDEDYGTEKAVLFLKKTRREKLHMRIFPYSTPINPLNSKMILQIETGQYQPHLR